MHTRQWLYVIARYLVSALVITYGFAKLNGSQFNVLDSELDKPMGEVRAFWLTWYFFGYSPIYSSFIALAQVLGGVLLMFRKTTLLGACVLLPVIANIVLVDIFYGIATDALVVALLIMSALLFILSQHYTELVDVFWTRQNQVIRKSQRSVFTRGAKRIVCAALLAIPFLITYWAANYNNRRPTPLDGTWEFVESSGDTGEARIPSVIFFEHNAAYLVVFKYGPRMYEEHHFRVERDMNRVTIWERGGRDRGERIFDGTYDVMETTLVLRGRLAHRAEDSTLRWARRSRIWERPKT